MKEACIPLELTNKMTEKYHPWDYVEGMRTMNGDDVEWDTKCYIPIAATLAITDFHMERTTEKVYDANIIAAIAPWRIYKQIYEFDPDMEKLLLSQGNDDLVIPIEVLSNIPYPSIYIRTKTRDYDGFFVHFESDVNNGDLELRFLLVDLDCSVFPISLHLVKNKTISEGLDLTMEAIRKNDEDHFFKDGNKLRKIYDEEVPELIQLVLYICAQNSEIEEDPVQKKITQKPKSVKSVKDKYREIQKWDCGKTTGEIIRKIGNKKTYPQSNSMNICSGTSKRPHSRKAHWHHFWTGKIGTDERKLILKWMPPMFIHGTGVESEIITRNVL